MSLREEPSVPAPRPARPLLLATWSTSQQALAAAWPGLAAGGSALDAVETAVAHAEADVSNPTVGVGGFPDQGGRVSLDAAIMISPARNGAVCATRQTIHPITAARRVMESTPHNLLAGESADVFAKAQNLPTGDLLTDASRLSWQKWKDSRRSAQPVANIEEKHHDTIGVLGMDARGLLVAGCSTSGLAWKLPGRVGDSPIIGQGLYADPAAGAAVCTGHGELAAGVCAAFLAVETLRRGASPLNAAREVLTRINHAYRLTVNDQVGIIVLAADGRFATASLRPGYKTAIRTHEGAQVIDPDFIHIPPSGSVADVTT